jgi:hypothetical protein
MDGRRDIVGMGCIKAWECPNLLKECEFLCFMKLILKSFYKKKSKVSIRFYTGEQQ